MSGPEHDPVAREQQKQNETGFDGERVVRHLRFRRFGLFISAPDDPMLIAVRKINAGA